MSFTPGYSNGYAPYGTVFAQWYYWAHDDLAMVFDAANGSPTDDETAYDYVVVVLEEDIGDTTGWMGIRTYSTDWDYGRYWDHVGYPADVDGAQTPQLFEDGMIVEVRSVDWTGETGYAMDTDIDNWKGQSGGPLYAMFDADYFIIGVMTVTADDFNVVSGGPALTSVVSRAVDSVSDVEVEQVHPDGKDQGGLSQGSNISQSLQLEQLDALIELLQTP